MTAVRLAWRLQRAELLFCLGLCAGLAAVALWQAADMRSMLTGCGTPEAARECQFVYPFQEGHGQVVSMLQTAADYVPYAVGLLLGVPVVARDVERRTALVAWPLAGSRIRWLAYRVLPVAVTGVVLVSLLAVASGQMGAAYLPKSDLGFLEYEGRGIPLVMRTLVALAIGLTLGAVFGRVLLGLLVGIAVSVALFVGLGIVLDRWVPSAAMTAAQSPESGRAFPLTTEVRYRLPDGSVVSAQEGEILVEAAYQASGGEEPDPASLPQAVYYGVAGDRYPEVVARESIALGVLTGMLVVGTGLIVRRRRPE